MRRVLRLSLNVDLMSSAVEVGNSELTVVLVKDKEKKRHRDGCSSRNHHSKKFKKPMVLPSSDGLVLKVGAESCETSSGGGLLLCKSYVEKV